MPQQVAITGNTYPVKDALKAMGARWNADAKAWMVSADKAAAARKIVAGTSDDAARKARIRRTLHRQGYSSNGGYPSSFYADLDR